MLSKQVEAPKHPGVPQVLVNMVTALRIRGLDAEGLYRVPGRTSKVKEIENLANSNIDVLSEQLLSSEEAYDGRAISSAVKRYLATLPESLLDADVFATAIGERPGQSLRTPTGLARALWQVQAALTSCIGCPGGKKSTDRERGWRLAT
ncbi:unnamed protein product, partial [Dibothriocephalus latus]